MNLGQVLSDARKDLGISIDDLAAALSIRPGLLIEIEGNDFAKCGGDVYARGHLRNIAPVLGLDSAHLISLYDNEHSIEGLTLNAQLVENNIAKVPHEKKSITWKVPAAFSLTLLLVVGTVQIVLSNSSDVADPNPVVITEPTAEATDPSPTASEPTASEPTGNPSAPAASANVAMTIVASAAARIDIVIDGTHVYKGEIAAGESKSFESDSSISVYFSDASAIEVTVNGENLGRLGGAGEVIRRTFR